MTQKVLLDVHETVFRALDASDGAEPEGEREWDVRHALGKLRKQVLGSFPAMPRFNLAV